MPNEPKKRVDAKNFGVVKAIIEKKGIKAAVGETGYSITTIRSLAAASDYTSWRAERRASNKATSAATSKAETPAPAPKAPIRPSDFVTRAEVDAAFGVIRQSLDDKLRAQERRMTTLNRELEAVEKTAAAAFKVANELEKAETAMMVDRLIPEQPRSIWQRLLRKF